ncbi:MAG: hypothetical protein WBF58_03190 [Xanthobacteraceae bacterium]
MPTAAASEAAEDRSSTAAALYIRTLTEELARIARRHRYEGLAYILDMARLEADQIATSSTDGRVIS